MVCQSVPVSGLTLAISDGAPLALVASGVTTSAKRCIALLGNSGHTLAEIEFDFEASAQCLNCALKRLQRGRRIVGIKEAVQSGTARFHSLGHLRFA
jgi:hypothetical protein